VRLSYQRLVTLKISLLHFIILKRCGRAPDPAARLRTSQAQLATVSANDNIAHISNNCRTSLFVFKPKLRRLAAVVGNSDCDRSQTG